MKYSTKATIDALTEKLKINFNTERILEAYPEIEITEVDKTYVVSKYIGHGENTDWEEFATATLKAGDDVLYTTLPWSAHIISDPLEAYFMIGREIVLCMGAAILLPYSERIRLLRICELGVYIHRDLGGVHTNVPRLSRFNTDAYEWYRVPVYNQNIPEGYSLYAQSRVIELGGGPRLRDIPRLEGVINTNVRVETQWKFHKLPDSKPDSENGYKPSNGFGIDIIVTSSSLWKGEDFFTQSDAITEFLKITGKL